MYSHITIVYVIGPVHRRRGKLMTVYQPLGAIFAVLDVTKWPNWLSRTSSATSCSRDESDSAHNSGGGAQRGASNTPNLLSVTECRSALSCATASERRARIEARRARIEATGSGSWRDRLGSRQGQVRSRRGEPESLRGGLGSKRSDLYLDETGSDLGGPDTDRGKTGSVRNEGIWIHIGEVSPDRSERIWIYRWGIPGSMRGELGSDLGESRRI